MQPLDLVLDFFVVHIVLLGIELIVTVLYAIELVGHCALYIISIQCTNKIHLYISSPGVQIRTVHTTINDSVT